MLVVAGLGLFCVWLKDPGEPAAPDQVATQEVSARNAAQPQAAVQTPTLKPEMIIHFTKGTLAEKIVLARMPATLAARLLMGK